LSFELVIGRVVFCADVDQSAVDFRRSDGSTLRREHSPAVEDSPRIKKVRKQTGKYGDIYTLSGLLAQTRQVACAISSSTSGNCTMQCFYSAAVFVGSRSTNYSNSRCGVIGMAPMTLFKHRIGWLKWLLCQVKKLLPL
jgi:hypothetical protein